MITSKRFHHSHQIRNFKNPDDFNEEEDKEIQEKVESHVITEKDFFRILLSFEDSQYNIKSQDLNVINLFLKKNMDSIKFDVELLINILLKLLNIGHDLETRMLSSQIICTIIQYNYNEKMYDMVYQSIISHLINFTDPISIHLMKIVKFLFLSNEIINNFIQHFPSDIVLTLLKSLGAEEDVIDKFYQIITLLIQKTSDYDYIEQIANGLDDTIDTPNRILLIYEILKRDQKYLYCFDSEKLLESIFTHIQSNSIIPTLLLAQILQTGEEFTFNYGPVFDKICNGSPKESAAALFCTSVLANTFLEASEIIADAGIFDVIIAKLDEEFIVRRECVRLLSILIRNLRYTDVEECLGGDVIGSILEMVGGEDESVAIGALKALSVIMEHECGRLFEELEGILYDGGWEAIAEVMDGEGELAEEATLFYHRYFVDEEADEDLP